MYTCEKKYLKTYGIDTGETDIFANRLEFIINGCNKYCNTLKTYHVKIRLRALCKYLSN